jgi:hypothetical protein
MNAEYTSVRSTAIPKPITRCRGRLGRCYELAGKVALDHPEWQLIHGTVRGFGHAWLERDGFVFDVAADELFAVEDYYLQFHPVDPVRRYSQREAAQEMVRRSLWGPWHEAPASAAAKREGD